MNAVIRSLVFASIAACASAQTVNEVGMFTTSNPTNVGFVSIPDNPTLTPANALTVEGWFYLLGLSGEPTIIRKSIGYPEVSYVLRIENNGTLVKGYLRVNTSTYEYSATVQNVANAWHHLAQTYDGAVIRLYFDGNQVTSVNTAGTVSQTVGNLQIGKGATSSEFFYGSLDEIRLWSVARTQSQIQIDRFRELGPTPGLISAWRMNGDFTDSIGNFDGAAVGPVLLTDSTSPVIGTYLVAPTVAPIGGIIAYHIESALTGVPYVFDVSVNGSSPGVVIPGVATIPLNQPWLYQEYNFLAPPGTFNNFLGIIPPSHAAFPTVDLPSDPILIGLTLSSAFVLLDPTLPTLISHVSSPRATLIGMLAPSISTVVPATSPQSGGAVVTITGNHFQSGATVAFDGVPATNVVVNSATSITATTPPGALGPATVRVTNPDGLENTVNAFTYVPNLVLSSIAPLAAPAGALVTISGSGFVPGLQLSVSGAPVTPINILPTAVTFSAPPNSPCNATVSVVNPDLQTGNIAWNPSPSIQQVINNQGSAGGGGSFFLLGAFTSGTTVTVGGTPATTSGTAIALLVVAPPGIPGIQPVVVTSSTGCTANTTYFYQ